MHKRWKWYKNIPYFCCSSININDIFISSKYLSRRHRHTVVPISGIRTRFGAGLKRDDPLKITIRNNEIQTGMCALLGLLLGRIISWSVFYPFSQLRTLACFYSKYTGIWTNKVHVLLRWWPKMESSSEVHYCRGS